MTRADHLEVLATLAEVAPHLGLDATELQRAAGAERVAEHERGNPYTFTVWLHHVSYVERERTLGEAIDMWIAMAGGDDCAMSDDGIFLGGVEIVSVTQLWEWRSVST